MASLNQSVPVGLDLGSIAQARPNGWGAEECNPSAREFADGAEVQQADGCPLLRGILIATIPALLMWGAILEIAARLF